MNEDLLIENIRLSELVLIVQQNRAFFQEFEGFLQSVGYQTIHAFIVESSTERAADVIRRYFARTFTSKLLDGIGRPLPPTKAKWYFMAWLFRDAAEQRLKPLLVAVEGESTSERRVSLLNKLRGLVLPLFPDPDSWKWPAFSEVMLARLEGSRRASRGGQFEKRVRQVLGRVLGKHKIAIKITGKGVKLLGETYDVEVVGGKGKILLPVKTRETMGGGHALLFTRDIHKAITVAQANSYECIPIIIAESWGGDLAALPCNAHIHIPLNPNLIDKIEPFLEQELEKQIRIFRSIS